MLHELGKRMEMDINMWLNTDRHGTWSMDMDKHMNTHIAQSTARGQYRKGQYNADFYVGGAMANTFPMMRKGAAGHAIKPPVGYFT